MLDNDNKNRIELSDEYAEIFASVYGDESKEPADDVPEETVDWDKLYSAPADTSDMENIQNPDNSYSEGYHEQYESDAPHSSEIASDSGNYVNQSFSPDSGTDNPSEVSDSQNGYFENEDFEENDEDINTSFTDYVSAKIAGTLYRLHGSNTSSTAVMYDESTSMGREVSPMYASKYYGSQIYPIRIRFKIALAVSVLMFYFSMEWPVPGMLNNIYVMIYCILAMQFLMIILCLDVFTKGITNMFSGKFGIDSLAAISCFITVLDAVYTCVSSTTEPHMPLCVISSVSLLGVLLSSFLCTRGMRKALRVPAIGKRIYTVTGESDIIGHDITLLKSTKSTVGLVRRTEEEPLDEREYKKASPLILILSVALTAVILINKKYQSYNAIYILSLIMCPAVSFNALLCYALPFYTGSNRIFSSGAAIAGWSGACNLGMSKNLIVTDRDLFPTTSIEIENVRIFADYDSQKVISYAGSMIIASESSLVDAFQSLMEENGCTSARVDDFEVLSGGGFKGLIEGHVVTCGSTDLMRLLGVRIPFRLVSPRTVLLAIDGILYGIFNIKYSADDDVRRALVNLMRSNRHPVFATRDFNVTPDMIKEVFDVATDGYDFPPYADRFPISMAKPSAESQISAVVCREGLGPLTDLADTGRSIYVITRINTVISLIFSVLAPVVFFFLLLKGKPFGILFELIYMAASTIPVLILGVLTKTPN